ncbi:CHAT domain-containing protein [Planctomicrobium sp. SH664]|uniref:CHAT domain-containing protein n=1 Tax=Planctomicrobium sp. SH664 TaxID=3448125 RepID=UPI003F5B7E76
MNPCYFGRTCCALLAGWLLLLVIPLGVTAADTPSNSQPVRSLISSNAIGAVWLRPAELVASTEFEILGDVPFLELLPVPPSQIGEIAFWQEVDPEHPGPVTYLVLRFLHEMPAGLLVDWLAPGAERIADRPLPSYRHAGQLQGGMLGGHDLVMIDPRTIVLLENADNIQQLLERDVEATTGLPPLVRSLPPECNVWLALDAGRIRQVFDEGISVPAAGSFPELMLSVPAELAQLQVAMAFGKTGSRLDLELTKRTDVTDTGALETWAATMTGEFNRMVELGEEAIARRLPQSMHPRLREIAQQVQTQLGKIQHDAPARPLHFSDSHLPSLTRSMRDGAHLLEPFIMLSRQAAYDMQRQNNYKQALLALMIYHDREGKLPQNILDAQGQPLLSWRVRLLPELGYGELFQQFKLDEAWDGPHNRQLLAQMPDVFRSPGLPAQPAMTRVRAVDGPQTAFGDGVSFRDVTDGLSQTVVLVETGAEVPWSKPEDLIPLQKDILAQLQQHPQGAVLLGFLDGHVESPWAPSDEQLSILFHYRDGKVVTDPPSVEATPKPVTATLEQSLRLIQQVALTDRSMIRSLLQDARHHLFEEYEQLSRESAIQGTAIPPEVEARHQTNRQMARDTIYRLLKSPDVYVRGWAAELAMRCLPPGDVARSPVAELKDDANRDLQAHFKRVLNEQPGTAGTFSGPRESIKAVLLNWHLYYDVNSRFPGNYVDSTGKPLLSWRVRLLPLMGEQDLFARFHLDEPWDSPHNRELIARIPAVYERRDGTIEDGTTRLLAVTGPKTIFTDGVQLNQITDGTSNTALLVAAEKPVVWTKPEDFEVPQSDTGRSLYRLPIGTFVVGMADGSVKSAEKVSDSEFKSWSTYAGAELSLLEQRNQLWEQVKQEAAGPHRAQALVTGRKMLALEEEMLGPVHDEVLSTLGWLATQASAQGDARTALDYLNLKLERTGQRFGEQAPATVDARTAARLHEFEMKMTPVQRQLFGESLAELEKVKAALQQNDLKTALAAAEKRCQLLRSAQADSTTIFCGPLRDCRALLQRSGELPKSLEVALELQKLNASQLGEHYPAAVKDSAEYGLLLQASGQTEKAVTILTQFYDQIVQHCEPTDVHHVADLLASHAIQQGDSRAAYLLAGQAIHRFQQQGQTAEALTSCLSLGRQLNPSREPRYALCALFEGIWRAAKAHQTQGFRANYHQLALYFRNQGKPHLELGLRQTYLGLVEQSIPGGQVSLNEYAGAYLELAETSLELGDFSNADRYYGLVMRVLKGQGEAEPTPPVSVLLGCARIMQYQKNPAREEVLLRLALQHAQARQSQDLADDRRCLRQLAEFRQRQGKLDEALALSQQLAATYPDGFHSDGSMRDRVQLARLLADSGQTEPALELARPMLEIIRQQLSTGSLSPQVAEEMADLMLACHEPATARELSIEALQLCQQRHGPESRAYSRALLKRALVAKALGDIAVAEAAARESLRISRKALDHSMYALSPRQQMGLREHSRQSLDLYLSLDRQTPAAARLRFNEIYRWKGESQLRQRNLHQLMQHAEVKAFHEQLAGLTNRLLKSAQQKPLAEDAPEFVRIEQETQNLSQLKESLEQQLSAAALTYLDLSSHATVEDFLKSLPPDSLFIDYFAYQNSSLTGAPGEYQLLATLIRSDGFMQTIRLGPLAPIEAEIESWRRSFGSTTDGRAAGAALRRLLWDPVSDHLGDAQLVLISPDGPLGQLPFSALPGRAPQTYLLQDHRLAVVTVPQLMTSTLSPLTKSSHRLLLLGDIDYQAAEAVPKSSVALAEELPQAVRGGQVFTPLPGTATEVEAIAGLFRKGTDQSSGEIRSLVKQQASEAAFRQFAPDCRTLHIATHGFFAPRRSAGDASGLAVNSYRYGNTESIDAYHPGLLSGLAFAGANSPDPQQTDDGILTADEIASLPLSEVDLAVLSACETGIGQMTHGDGLISIQRAFQIAGVRSTIASLWKVNDHATQVLMARFYRNLQGGGLSRLDALREAQLWMLEHPQEVWAKASTEARGLRRVKSDAAADENPKQLAPEFWAAFVLSGNWK